MQAREAERLIWPEKQNEDQQKNTEEASQTEAIGKRHKMKKKYVFTKARKRALLKARRKWMRMSPKARRKAMPARNPRPKKRYKVGQIITIDVGRPGHHYIRAKKTKYGWKAGPLRKYKRK